MSFTLSTNLSVPTERLHISYLNPGEASHYEFLHNLWNTEDFLKSEGDTGLDTVEKAREFIATKVQADYARNRYGQMLVSLKPHTGASLSESKPIGIVSLMKGEGKNAYTAPDIGYSILPEENGYGYATEAATGLIAYAKRELGVKEVLGFCGVDDKRSQRVLEKIGMEAQGERHLKFFGGIRSAVYAFPGIGDLKRFGIDEE